MLELIYCTPTHQNNNNSAWSVENMDPKFVSGISAHFAGIQSGGDNTEEY